MGAFIDLTGCVFGRLTVIKRVECIRKDKKVTYLCKCECGNECKVIGKRLKNGNTKSCGCLNLEMILERNITHNLSKHPLYRILADIKKRCNNPNFKTYKNYGGRGISVCKEWTDDFLSFYNWSMDNGYEEGLTIDRINNDGNYEPSNCRWVTLQIQANNKRNNRLITIKGITLTLAQWAKKKGIHPETLRGRLDSGWDESKLFIKPKVGGHY